MTITRTKITTSLARMNPTTVSRGPLSKLACKRRNANINISKCNIWTDSKLLSKYQILQNNFICFFPLFLSPCYFLSQVCASAVEPEVCNGLQRLTSRLCSPFCAQPKRLSTVKRGVYLQSSCMRASNPDGYVWSDTAAVSQSSDERHSMHIELYS